MDIMVDYYQRQDAAPPGTVVEPRIPPPMPPPATSQVAWGAPLTSQEIQQLSQAIDEVMVADEAPVCNDVLSEVYSPTMPAESTEARACQKA
jgi:hypothetical protein